jgi:lipopolysaccharide/colanic/teichoic acid biosynthesis glycosyltransferase
MLSRTRQDDLVSKERLEHDTTLPPRGTDDTELELAPSDLLDDALRIEDRERYVDFRMSALELAEKQRNDRPTRPSRRTELETPGQHAGVVRQLREQLLLRCQHSLSTAVEAPPGLRRLDAPPRAVEELLAESLFQRPDLKAHGGLRHPEPLRGLREAAPLDNRAKRGELTRIHKQLLYEQAEGRTPSASPQRASISRVPETTPALEDTLIRGYRQLAQASPRRSRDAVLRLLDVGFSAVFLLVLLPVSALIAVTILVTSGRPILYGGERVGLGGRVFRMFKFRTLKPDAETRLGPYLGPDLVARTESEFAPLGRWLKASQLDEIPQFWNVLRGDMSLVGPRPIRPIFFEELARGLPAYWQRLVVRPGLTGFAQVRRGYETSMAEKLAHDLEWIADRSVRLYLRTVVATGWRVLRQSLRGLVSRPLSRGTG